MDQDTGRPIEGAVVFVEWHIHHALTGVADTHFDAEEVLTDKDGNFRVSRNWSLLPWRNFFMDSSVLIFKAGYGKVKVHWSAVMEGALILAELPPEERGNPKARCDRAYGTSAQIYFRCFPPERWGNNPGLLFYINYEGDLPVFMLKKLATAKERYDNHWSVHNALPVAWGEEVAKRKAKLTRAELEADKALGLSREGNVP